MQKGTILPIYMLTRLEGYARLIEPCGEEVSYMSEETEENGAVFIKQRWLIEWVKVEECTRKLTMEERWTQRSLEGKRTHRTFSYYEAESWEDFIERHENPTYKNHYERGKNRGLDENYLAFPTLRKTQKDAGD